MGSLLILRNDCIKELDIIMLSNESDFFFFFGLNYEFWRIEQIDEEYWMVANLTSCKCYFE